MINETYPSEIYPRNQTVKLLKSASEDRDRFFSLYFPYFDMNGWIWSDLFKIVPKMPQP